MKPLMTLPCGGFLTSFYVQTRGGITKSEPQFQVSEGLTCQPNTVELELEGWEPQVFWASGVSLNVPSLAKKRVGNFLRSERAAWIRREALLKDPAYRPITEAPEQVEGAHLNEYAARLHCNYLRIHNDDGSIYDEWSVPQ